MNANVTPKTLKQNSKTPIAVMLLGFFLFKISDEQSDEQVMNNLFNLKTHMVKYNIFC